MITTRRFYILAGLVFLLSLISLTGNVQSAPSANNTYLPLIINQQNIKKVPISAGFRHTCALTSNGIVKCWGWNTRGQLGDGTISQRLTPVPVNFLSPGIAAITAGDLHTCMLSTIGGVQCWGSNSNGQLGDSTINDHIIPMPVTGESSGVVEIAAGDSHTCVLTKDSEVQCWGGNVFGQLGDSTTNNSSIPVAVPGLSSGVIAITSGYFHTCALTTGGGVLCWGDNGNGQLGNNSTTNRLSPVAVSGLSSGVEAISAGGYHTCALLKNNSGVKCWGYNVSGELGNNSTVEALTPVTVSNLSSGVVSISAGDYHTCALTTGGGVLCWGDNVNGQLGNTTTTRALIPSAVSGLSSGVTYLAAGGFHTCAMTIIGGVKCWGSNNYGQLGDGIPTSAQTTPADVISFP